MLQEKETKHILKTLKEVGDRNTLNLVVKYLKAEIDNLREDNDEAKESDFILNQGGIKTLKRIKDIFLRELS